MEAQRPQRLQEPAALPTWASCSVLLPRDPAGRRRAGPGPWCPSSAGTASGLQGQGVTEVQSRDVLDSGAS